MQGLINVFCVLLIFYLAYAVGVVNYKTEHNRWLIEKLKEALDKIKKQ